MEGRKERKGHGSKNGTEREMTNRKKTKKGVRKDIRTNGKGTENSLPQSH
jgi:hypothetical protein